MNADDLSKPSWLPVGWLLPLSFNLPPGTPFNDAVLHIAEMHWWEFYRIDDWEKLFPYPKELQLFTLSSDSIQIKRLQWKIQALESHVNIQGGVRQTYDRVISCVQMRIRIWEHKLASLIDLDPEIIARRWLNILEDSSVKHVYKAYVYETKVYEFVDKQIEASRLKWELPELNGLSDDDKNNQPSIHVLPDARAHLIDSIRPYVDVMQQKDLSDLIHFKTSPAKPILCRCEQTRLGQIFYDQVKSKHKEDRNIQEAKTVITRWICLHFRRMMAGEEKEPDYEMMLRHLKGGGFAQYK